MLYEVDSCAFFTDATLRCVTSFLQRLVEKQVFEHPISSYLEVSINGCTHCRNGERGAAGLQCKIVMSE